MERISEIMAAQNALERRQAEPGINKKHKKRKRTTQQKFRIFAGHSQITHFIMDSIISDKTLNKRELKVLFLIMRLTIGLQIRSVDFKKADFEAAGVLPNHISKILKSLSDKLWISVTGTPKITYYALHKIRFTQNLAVKNRKLNNLIHKKLLKYSRI